MTERVFIVLEGPDMTYYGDAKIHGVYATKEEAEAAAQLANARMRCRACILGHKSPHDHTPVPLSEFDNIGVEEWGIGESE